MKIKTGHGFKIYQARTNKGLSQEELADKVGVSRTSLNYWETNKFIPSKGNLNKLSKILEKPISYFFEETVDNSFNHGIINNGDNKDSNFTNSVINGGEQKSIKGRLRELLELKDEGLITENEFTEKKKEILGGI
jgi:transcriptional regulator with XRE-family HTH domain